jgi:hypothetical protein
VLGQFAPRVKLHFGDAEVHGRQLASNGQGLTRKAPAQPMLGGTRISHGHAVSRKMKQETTSLVVAHEEHSSRKGRWETRF